MRNPFNPVDRATLGLDLRYFLEGMRPTGSSRKMEEGVVYQKRIQLISSNDQGCSLADSYQRADQAKKLAERAAAGVNLEVVMSGSSWGRDGACYTEISLCRRME